VTYECVPVPPVPPQPEELLSFAIFAYEPTEIVLQVQISTTERTAGTLPFNAVVFNDTFQAVSQVGLQLTGGAEFGHVGSVLDFDSHPVPVSSTLTTATITPEPALPDADLLEIGNFLLDSPGADDWELDVSGVPTTLRFTLRIDVVPEPGGGAELAFAGLLALASLRRAQRA
jgi:hypothetical protein